MENKKISCSYALLVIILFAALAFVTVYAYVQDRIRTCSCPKCESGSVITDNSNTSTGEKVYSYDDLAGYYRVEFPDLDDDFGNKVNSVYNLYLYSDATFYYTHSSHSISGKIGTYTIDGNKIVLNTLFTHGSDVATVVNYSIDNISFNNNFEISLNMNDEIAKKDVVLSRIEKFDESNNSNSNVKGRLSQSELYNK